jgi:hypothetical protein
VSTFKHPIPKRVPQGVVSNGRTPLLTIDATDQQPTPLFAKSIGSDPNAREADRFLVEKLYDLYGSGPFRRGNLDAGRVNRLFSREIKPVLGQFHPQATNALLQLDLDVVRVSFPDLVL